MDALQTLRELVQTSANIVFFGGAGVSTESDIPDFRGAGGLYADAAADQTPPEILLTRSYFEAHPQEFFAFYFDKMVFAKARPNKAHLALAKLERQGKLKTVITQNIDGLHQLAGSQKVLELHGSIRRNYCLNCGARYDLAFMLGERPGVPHCLDCGGIVRPDVVLYEEALDSKLLGAACSYLQAADLLIVGGTSLAVYPAAGLLRYYGGRNLALINKTPTDYDAWADLMIRGSVGEALDFASR